MLRTLDGPRRLPSEIDLALLWSTLVLLVIGMVMVYSASMATAEAGRVTANQPTYYLVRHAVFSDHRAGRRRHCLSGARCRPGSAGRRGSSSPASCCWRWC
jgi:hypothetical protein